MNNKISDLHDGFMEDLCDILNDFEADIKETECPDLPMTTPECSTLEWFEKLD